MMNLGVELSQHLALDDPNLFDRIIHLKQIVARIPEGLQKNSGRHFPPTVNAHIENVASIKFEIQPRSAIGNNPRGVQHLAAGVRPALIVRKGRTGRPMQLADHHPLRAVDNEGSPLRHERQLADVDFLFSNVEDLFLGALIFLVEHDQAHPELQRNGKGHPLLETFPLIILRGAKGVARKLQYGRIVVIRNRENTRQGCLEPMIFATLWLNLPLKEFFIRALLDLDKIRNVDATMNTRVVFPLDELLESRFGHSPVLHYNMVRLGRPHTADTYGY